MSSTKLKEYYINCLSSILSHLMYGFFGKKQYAAALMHIIIKILFFIVVLRFELPLREIKK